MSCNYIYLRSKYESRLSELIAKEIYDFFIKKYEFSIVRNVETYTHLTVDYKSKSFRFVVYEHDIDIIYHDLERYDCNRVISINQSDPNMYNKIFKFIEDYIEKQ